MKSRLLRCAMLATITLVVSAHVGSPDTYFEGAAGAYPVRVIVRNPGIVPGLAEIAVRVLAPHAVREVRVLPVFWDPKTAAPPPPDVAKRVPGDSLLYGASLWLMNSGSYSVQVTVVGEAGTGTVLVPVMAVATRRLGLPKALGSGLAVMGLVLFAGACTIIGAAVRDAGLEPGAAPGARRTVMGRAAMGLSAVVLASVLLGGRAWWMSVDSAYRTNLYRPPAATATVHGSGGQQVLRLAIDERTPLVPDHGHLMHLFLVRDADRAAFAHLHPLPVDSATFETALPPLAPGSYRVYADIVLESGFAPTIVTTVDVPEVSGTWRPSDPDDAWIASPAGHVLDDGSTMTWNRGAGPLVVDEDALLRFTVTDPQGKPASLEPYMGMAGHAMLTRDDGAVFVHLHQGGTVPMAASETFAMREPGDTVRGRLGARMAAMRMDSGEPRGDAAALTFPYAFPKPGHYRIWVQVKRNGRILTGVFDAEVQSAASP